MAGNQSASSIVYEISADVEPLLHPFPASRNKPLRLFAPVNHRPLSCHILQ
ncbi:hypothetical protein SMW88_002498 [Cronobacter sakazakii]|nr:hypothetical protein [Cronobacter sakazakii]ELY3421440.1 hypothetical protein [Cronobacter sakazakii]ELY5906641.1 hypothetical protein [Cronobacter sakazakii]